MKKTRFYALAILLTAVLGAEAKNDKAAEKKGAAGNAMAAGREKGEQHGKAAEKKMEEAEKKGAEAAEKGKEQAEQAKAKGKRNSEEMKQAVAAKKEAQQAAKESGEKMTKEEKSWWKFWKK